VNRMIPLMLTVAVVAGGGCEHEKKHHGRPPVDEISDGGGLQGKDVISASDQMAQDLLSSPDINAQHTQLLIVVDHVDNRTQSQRFDMDIFLARLKTNLNKYGKGRVQLIENRDKLHQLQSRELEQGSAAAAGIQPDYALYATISELPNRDTSYFYLEFSMTNLHTRQLVWTNGYEVATYR